MAVDFCSLLVRTEVHRILMAFPGSITGTEGFYKLFQQPGQDRIELIKSKRSTWHYCTGHENIIKLKIKGIKICHIIFLKAMIVEEEVYC